MKRHRKAGFTLVEIMIVVLIIGLLAAIAIPSFVRARRSSRANACINNLRIIEAAKEQWAMATNAGDTATPSDADLRPYIQGNRWPSCPSGGTYTIGNMATRPTCSYQDTEFPHQLPQ